ncbi:MAG: sulfurtransferase [Pseudomonadota bacterium]|nr:sulfurtransferase [Pseudomonadota bacterium]
MDSLVTTEWLADDIGAPDLRIADATYFTSLPGEPPRDATAEYAAAHIPGAVFLDLATLADKANPLPATLPKLEQVASRMQCLGLGDGCRIVLYDNAPLHTAARAWWLLRAFGVANVAILDGGFAKWRAEGRPVARGIEQPRERHVSLRSDPARIRTLDEMHANLDSHAEQVLDARGAKRFTGDDPDPRPGTAPGHIPGSRNLPYPQVLNADGTYRNKAALQAMFDDAGIDLAKPVTMTCGSGITASIIAFAAHLLGAEAAVYDGSWSEWGGDLSTPKAIGPA